MSTEQATGAADPLPDARRVMREDARVGAVPLLERLLQGSQVHRFAAEDKIRSFDGMGSSLAAPYTDHGF